MASLSSNPALYRFGSYEFEPRTGELRKQGIRIRFDGQPVAILLMLLNRPGELITREELQKKLWPADTFVDFEHSLNAAVKRLRSALNDSPDTPRFIETVPRRGYRFIAPVSHDGEPAGVESPVPATAPSLRLSKTTLRYGFVFLATAATALTLMLAFHWGHLRQRLWDAASAPRIQSLAVLPLHNLSHDPEQEYFSDGMTDELITDLAKVGSLRVISHTSVERYKETKRPLPEIARELGVDAVVEGTVMRSGDHVRITAQLIDARSDRHLWAETYERNLRDVLALQAEVSRDIATEVKIKLTPQDQARLSNARSIAPEAYEAYLKGRYFWNKRTVEGFKKALKYFDEAIARDPNYALAYVGVADSYTMLADYDWLPPLEAAARAKTAVTRALEIDDKLAEAHTSLADIKRFYDWDWLGAEREYKRAIELNPNYGTAHQWYAEYLSAMGRPQQAIREMERAQELDPLSVVVKSANGWVLLFAREYDQAIAQCQKVIELDPSFGEVYSQLRRAYEQKGMYTEALAADEKFRVFKSKGADRRRRLSQPIAISGAKAYWQKMHEVTEKDLRNNVEAARFRMAEIYAQQGQKDQALQWLERAYQEHSFWMPFLKVHPHLDPLRSDPRFQDLLRRVGFPQ